MLRASNSTATLLASAMLAAVAVTSATSAGAQQAAAPRSTPVLPAFTSDQCRAISAVGVEVARTVGPQNLSDEFKQSFRAFLGQNLTCDGPREISIVRGKDSDAWQVIQHVLEGARTPPIVLARYGVRGVVRSAELTGLRPTPVSVNPN